MTLCARVVYREWNSMDLKKKETEKKSKKGKRNRRKEMD